MNIQENGFYKWVVPGYSKHFYVLKKKEDFIEVVEIRSFVDGRLIIDFGITYSIKGDRVEDPEGESTSVAQERDVAEMFDMIFEAENIA